MQIRSCGSANLLRKERIVMLQLFSRFLRKVNSACGHFSAALILILGVIVTYDVVLRTAGNPTIWVFETSSYLMIAASFLGAAYGLEKGAHFRVTILTERLSPAAKRIVSAATSTVALAFCLIFIWQSVNMVEGSLARDLRSPTLLHTPLFLPQMVLPLSGIFLSLQLIETILRDLGLVREEL
jgi:TRAP-type C4-dicarboxylate transport system permease small subunit